MRESGRRHLTRPAGALVLAGFVASALAIVSPPRLSEAARAPTQAALAGKARAIDGDTLVIGETRVRLEGIDAPEASQTCTSPDRGEWDCGKAATSRLAELLKGPDVRCESVDTDKYGRALGVCWSGGREINAELVREGLAWAFIRYSDRLMSVEAEARGKRLGIWSGNNVPAWEYRAGSWAAAESVAPRGCAIKGNISKGGARIYHVPWNPSYNSVRIDTERGERWFCSESEAAAAGWRPIRSQ